MILLLVITDGRRGCIEQTIPSALANLCGPVTRRIIYDDSGDLGYRGWLLDRFGPLSAAGFDVFSHPDGRQGFGGAIRAAWRVVRDLPGGERFVFHLEDDFTFRRPVDLAGMASVLDHQSHLVQLALRRQPWNDEERAAGGIVEQHPWDYTECCTGEGRHWLEHRRFFTTNPSLYRRSLCEREWPAGPHSEGVFTHQLLADPALRFGFWGSRRSGEWVEHIGVERAGVGY